MKISIKRWLNSEREVWNGTEELIAFTLKRGFKIGPLIVQTRQFRLTKEELEAVGVIVIREKKPE